MPPDLTARAYLEEQMDHVATFREYRICLHDLDSVSRTVLAHRPTLAFLDQIAATHPGPLQILDVACGDGAMLRRIARWATRRKLQVHLTGLDLNPRAIRVAEKFPQSTPPVAYVIDDVFDYAPAIAPHVILSAHFTHHLTDYQIVRFLGWMERTARLGWFVNDLHRHPNPYRLFRLLSTVAPWHPIVVSDGLISIRRAFTTEDWKRLVCEAKIPECTIAEQFPARVTVASIKP